VAKRILSQVDSKVFVVVIVSIKAATKFQPVTVTVAIFSGRNVVRFTSLNAINQ